MVAITNLAAGPRGLHTTEGFVLVEVGASITADLIEGERKSAESTGYFEFDDDGDDEGDADDLTGLKVAELLDVAKAEAIDLGEATRKADVLAAIRTARASKTD